ncbi:hypothetical protein MMC10_006499 [Thelotrema lepadinum]|nr:hypothetical protein [Thelotrema lepadinum]
MPTPLPSLSLPSPPTTSSSTSRSRKRSHSSLEKVSFSPPYDIKRARTGIQELSTDDTSPSLVNALSNDDSTSLPSLVNSLSSAATADSPETQESPSDTSTSLSEEESSSSDDSEGYFEVEVDEGYDSDSESGSTSTSSSSSSSEDEGYGKEEGLRSRDHSIGLSSPSPAQLFPQSNLASRLNAFLPALAASNAELEVERAKGTLDERDIEKVDEEGYIEMDLGLGVLEEKRGHGEDSEEESDSCGSADEGNDAEDESEEVDGGRSAFKNKKKKKRVKREGDVMGRLMGRREGDRSAKQKIKVVEEGGL